MRTSVTPQQEAIAPPSGAPRVVVGRKRGASRVLHRCARSPWLLLPIVAVAFLLRVHGLNWDAGYHLHPDERFITIVITDRILPDWPPNWHAILDPDHSPLNARSLDPATGQPRDFAYGTLPLYVTKAVAGAMQAITGTAWTNYDHIYLVGRVLSALLDIGTLLLVYALARRYGRACANLAAALLAVCVLQIQLAHFFATDTWVTFFATAAVLAFVRAAERQRTRDFVIAGALVGAGVASKASVAFLAFPALASLAIASLRPRPVAGLDDEEPVSRRLRALFLALTTFWAALITFAVSEPYALFRLRTYLDAVGTQARLVRGDLDYPYTRQY
ncbi:MAG TPA: glycosyltransferase family 39 protein, partial [Thermomicrobiales bacterium]